MNGAIRIFLRKTFDIREGEELRALLMQLNIFLIISTLLIVKPTVNGLFLSKIGVERLPVAFVFVALFAAFISTLYARLLGKTSLNRILLFTLSTSVVLFIIFGFLLRLNVVEGWVLYTFYVWVAVFAVLTSSQFWILTNLVFNAREAKRLFGFIGAGAIAGGIFGGYLTTVLAEWIGSENLIFVGAGLLVFCIPITTYVWKNAVLPNQSKFQRRKKISKTDFPHRLILQSRHLTYLAGIIGISVIVAKLVDYQFSAIASSKITDPDELTAFFGFWFSNFNVISLFVQLFLTRRVVGTLGVGTSLIFLPAGIFLGAIFLFFFPELWAAVFIKMSDGSLKQSINKSAVELLALPIPADIKNQTKTFIDVFVDSVATGIGGLILIFLVNGLDLHSRFISIIIIGLLLLWGNFVLRVRKEYLRSFRLKVEEAREAPAPQLPVPMNYESILAGWEKVIQTGTEKQVLFVLRKFKERPDEHLFEAIRKLLDHPSESVRAEALNCLYFFKNQTVTKKAKQFTKDPSQIVKIAAFEYLIEHTPGNLVALMDNYLNDPDYKVRLAALVSLAKESRDNAVLKKIFNLEKRIDQQLAALPHINDPQSKEFHKIGVLKAMGFAKMPELFPQIEQFFKDDNLKVVRQAILSAGDTLHPYFIGSLIAFLGNKKLLEPAQMALSKYGREIVPVLFQFTKNTAADPEIIQAIPQVMSQTGTQEAVNMLFEMISHDHPNIRLAALRSLNRMKVKYPHLNYHHSKILKFVLEEAKLYQKTLSILYVQRTLPMNDIKPQKAEEIATARNKLVTLLEKQLDRNLERIFRLLGLKYPPEDINSVFQGIQSKSPDLRVNSIEYLDNLLEPGLKKVLIPIVETALLDTISDAVIQELNLKIPDETECFRMLLGGQNLNIKTAVFQLLEKREDDRFIPLLEEFTDNQNPKIKLLAKQTLNALTGK